MAGTNLSEFFPFRHPQSNRTIERTDALGKMLFPKAATVWLESRRPFLSSRTAADYEQHIRTLAPFFGETRLSEITADHVRAYQKMRLSSAGGRKINQEVGVIQQLLKRIGNWDCVAPDYQPMPVPRQSPGRALSEQEYERLFRVARRKPPWEMAYLFACISVNTTAGLKRFGRSS